MLYPEPEEEAFVLENDMDTAIPVYAEQIGGERSVHFYPRAQELVRLWLAACPEPLSAAGCGFLWQEGEELLAEMGYLPDREEACGSIFHCDKVAVGVPGTACRLGAEHEEENRTSYDFAATAADGRPMWGVRRDGAVVAAAVAACRPGDTGNVVEIGVETVAGYRRCGYATAAVIGLCKELIDRGFIVEYRAPDSNTASRGVALRCGFAECGRYAALVGRRRGGDGNGI